MRAFITLGAASRTGVTIRVKTVANPRPLAITKEIGAHISDVLEPFVENSPEKIFACQPKISGINPTIVVNVVRKTGRSLCAAVRVADSTAPYPFANSL